MYSETSVMTKRDIYDLHSNDAVLRIWLPAPVKQAMDECIGDFGLSASEYLREFLVVYLYGTYELQRMKSERTGLYFVPQPVEIPDSSPQLSFGMGEIMFSRASKAESIPGFGKNIVPLKLLLNAKLKADLEGLSDKAGIPLGQLVREIIVSHFMGHTVWPERNPLWTQEQKNMADAWVEDER